MFQRELAALEEIDPSGPEKEVEAARARIHLDIRSLAAREPGRTHDFVRQLNPSTDSDSFKLCDLYQALAPDASAHRDLYAAELARLLDTCAREPRNQWPCFAIQAFSLVGPRADSLLRAQLRDLMLARLQSGIPHVKRVCADMIGVFMSAGDSGATSALVSLLNDPDARVRIYAHLTLDEHGALPTGASLSILDRARMRFTNWTRYV
jgi:hypothetical protein